MMTKDSAYQKALKLLGRRDHFERELADKLRSREYPDDEISAAIARCIELGLVDDERVGARFVEIRAVDRGWGPHRLAGELRQRGVDSAASDRLSNLSPDLAEKALNTALRKIELRAVDGWWRDSQRRARMVSSLITRGFEAEVAIAAVDEMAVSRENQHHAFDDQ